MTLVQQQNPEVSPRFMVPSLLIGGLALVAPSLMAIRPDFVEPLAGWLFVVAIWVGLGIAYAYLHDSLRPPMPLLPLTGFFYIIFFAVPPFLIERGWWSNGGPAEAPTGILFERITTETACLVLLALLALASGYYGLRRLTGRIPRFRLAQPGSWLRLHFLLWAFAVSYLVYLYVPGARGSHSLSQAMTPVGFFAAGMLFILWYRGHLSVGEKLSYSTIFIPLVLLVHAYDGLVTPIILLFLFLISLYWYASHRAVVVLILVLCAALYIFPVLKLSNVFIVENSPTVADRVSDKVSAIGLAAQLFSGASRQTEITSTIRQKNIVQPLLRRIALVALLQYCVDQTPKHIPYLKGETLGNLLTNPVPRVFWPDKPKEMMGQWFGHHYRILGPADTITSINLPWLVEFYINFGPVGVIVGMTIIGALLAILEQILLNRAMTDLEIVTGWALVFRLFYQESNLSLMLGGLITQAVFFLGFIWLAVRLCCRPAPGAVGRP